MALIFGNMLAKRQKGPHNKINGILQSAMGFLKKFRAAECIGAVQRENDAGNFFGFK